MNHHVTFRNRLITVYNYYRTAMLNKKYYGYKLHRTRQINTAFEVAIAVGATGTGISGWAVWGSEIGQYVWAGVAGLASLLAVINPVIRFGERIERHTKLFSGYSSAYVEIQSLIQKIQQDNKITEQANEAFDRIIKVFSELAADDDPKPSYRLIKRLEDEVNKAIPPESLWMPVDAT